MRCAYSSPLIRATAVIALAVAFSAITSAQGLGTIVGTVTDPSGSLVPQASVTLIEEGTSFATETKTDEQGYYRFPSLRPTTYTFTVTASGFAPAKRNGVILQADGSVTLNITMSLEHAVESVTVDAAPPQVNTTSSVLSEVVDSRRLVDLPLNGRNAASLMLITAGTLLATPAGADQGDTKTFPAALTVSANGARQNQTSYRLDGASNNDSYTNVNQPFPFPDTLQEFSVQTSNYSAKYGGNAGALVNIVTKSGTNELHGSLFEFNRNAVFNARNFFAATRDQLKRNQFGGTLGGPLVLPRIYNGTNKTFFFLGYQGTRLRNTGLGKTAFIPTQENLAGDFSGVLSASDPRNPVGKATIIKDPTNGQAFPNNQIPATRLDPASLALMNYLPAATGNGQVFFGTPMAQAFNEVTVRGDHNISNADRLFLRYFFDRYENSPFLDVTNYLSASNQSTIDAQNAAIGETHVFAPTLLNDLRLNFVREVSNRGPAAGSINANDLGVNMWQPGEPKTIENVAASGFFTISQSDPATFTRNEYGISESLSWVKGGHSLSFGGDFARSWLVVRNRYLQPGTFTFTSDVTNFALASYMLGYIRTFRQGNGEFTDNRRNTFGLYAQDDFRVTRKLTVSLGLRFDPFFPWKETKGRIEVFRTDAYYANRRSQMFDNAPPGALFPGDSGVPEYGVKPNLKNFAPRVGFAYDVTGNGMTSIRGGFGIFYEALQSGYASNRAVNMAPFGTALVLTSPNGPFSDPYRGITNPFPMPFPPPRNVAFPSPVNAFTFDPGNDGRYQTPLAYNYNLTVERQLAANWMVRVGYVGSHGSHLMEGIQLSPAVYIPGSTLGPDQRRYLMPYSSVLQLSNDINSNYNSLQATVEKRFSKNFMVLANYTFAKSIDSAAFANTVATPSANSPIPWYMTGRHQFDHGPSDFDYRHRLTASYVWVLPKLNGSPALLRHVAGGWQVSGMITAQSGGPLTIIAGKDQSGTALGWDRAVALSDNIYGAGACGGSAPCVNYLIPSAFALPAAGTFGTLGKGTYRGPNMINIDTGLFKEIAVYRDQVRLQLRGEFFNTFNRVNFMDPGQVSGGAERGNVPTSYQPISVSAAGFGSIKGAFDPRIVQLAAKLTF
jgi:carboxypeptidase family protein